MEERFRQTAEALSLGGAMSNRFRPIESVPEGGAPVLTDTGRHNAEVLVLDDDSTLLTLLEEALSCAGLRCIVTKSPTAALRICGEHSGIRVVVSDVFMPQMNGLEFVTTLRSTRQSESHPQVLFLTGHPTMQTAIDALRLGAIDFLTKPVRPKELIEAVQRALGRARAPQPAPALSATSEITQLANHAAALAERLKRIASPVKAAFRLTPASPEASLPNTSLLDILSIFRELQSQLGDCKLDDVAWDLLHEIARAKYQDQTLSVSDLMVLQANVSSTTILRRINRLEELGFVQKLQDPADGRRDFVILTSAGSDLIDRFLLQARRHLEDTMLSS